MHYVTAEGLSKSFGFKPLFENISFHIELGDKIGLIARNGSGKTTLLKMLAGVESVEKGKLWINKEVEVVLFEQDPQFQEDLSVLDNIFNHDHPVLNAIKEYERTINEKDDHKIQEALILMDDLGAWDFEAKIKLVLDKLNITQLDQKAGTLSGGQRKRVALAKALIDVGFDNTHVLLIMDEPTNHLDVEMVEWLENYLAKERITLLLVTHDRYFLDNVCNEVWELEKNYLFEYKGDYENYIEKKSARIESDSASIDKAKNNYRKELEWIRKQPKARTTKSKSRIDAFVDVESKAKQKIENDQIQLQSKMNRLGGKIVELKKINKQYDEKLILKGFDYSFKKGDRIGVIGKNGVGKSTFLNIIQGMETPDSGKVNIGDTVVFGNYSQEGLKINDDIRVIEFVKNISENFPLANGASLSASQFLQLFLFSPEQQYTYVSKLSGGEKRRLHLLSILFRNPNFLILDEPTNDIDLPTLGVLENFLDDYPGCLLIVSHDRYFMDRLVEHLFVFEGEGIIRDYPGNFTQYRIWLKEQEQMKPSVTQSSKSSKNLTEQISKLPELVKTKMNFNEKREFGLLEKDIAKLEQEKQTITNNLNSGEQDFAELQKLSTRFLALSDMLSEKELRWLELSEKTL